jgi:hypothetical protein
VPIGAATAGSLATGCGSAPPHFFPKHNHRQEQEFDSRFQGNDKQQAEAALPVRLAAEKPPSPVAQVIP